MTEANEFKLLFEAAMDERNCSGVASVVRDTHGYTIKFAREDGIECGVSVGGRLSPDRSADDLVRIGSNIVSDWYKRFDDPQSSMWDADHPKPQLTDDSMFTKANSDGG